MAQRREKVDLVVREALPEDYKAVIDINRNVYDGSDYLPVMYHHFMQDPRAVCYVAEMRGEVVGLEIVYKNGDASVSTIAARTKYEGLGIMDQLKKQSLMKTSKQNPSIRKVGYATLLLPVYEKLLGKIEISKQMTLERIMHFMVYKIKWRQLLESKILKQENIPNEAQSVHVLNIDQAMKFLTKETTLNKIFDKKPFLVNQNGFSVVHPEAENMRKVFQEHTVMATIKDKGQMNEELHAVSFLTFLRNPIHDVLCADLHFYGGTTDELLGHIYCYLAIVQRQHPSATTGLQMGVTFPNDLDVLKVKNFMSEDFGCNYRPRGVEKFAIIEEPLFDEMLRASKL